MEAADREKLLCEPSTTKARPCWVLAERGDSSAEDIPFGKLRLVSFRTYPKKCHKKLIKKQTNKKKHHNLEIGRPVNM